MGALYDDLGYCNPHWQSNSPYKLLARILSCSTLGILWYLLKAYLTL